MVIQAQSGQMNNAIKLLFFGFTDTTLTISERSLSDLCLTAVLSLISI